MSIIVYHNGIMASDSGVWQGNALVGRKSVKIIKSHGHLLGIVGVSSIAQAIRDDFLAFKRINTDLTKDDKVEVIVVTPRRHIFLHNNGQCERTRAGYEVLGADAPTLMCIGAMEAGANAESAVRIAIRCCSGYAAGKVRSIRL